MSSRLSLGAEAGAFPRDGAVLLIGASADIDTTPFGAARLTVLHDMMPDTLRWTTRGAEVLQSIPDTRFDAAVVFLPRSRRGALDRVARAAAASSRVVVDGQKTDGVESLLKEIRRRVQVSNTLSKAHGKLFWFDVGDADFSDWLAESSLIDDRWHVAPGVFSADGVDPGSALLAAALPVHLSGRLADLGAGWGYLAASALERCAGISEIHLVEAQRSALDCARQNVSDPRARFHWADALDWCAARDLDAIIMNPPFHTGRATDPALGRSFIAAAARLLRPGGTLWMVANRQLAYEQALRESFDDVTEIGGDNRYKLLRAVAMARKRR